MKTKEFIKMLQEADPSGEAHVRMDGGIPQCAFIVPGYYDGSYSYLDENENWVRSTEGVKLDIHSMDIWDFVERHEELEWEDVKSKIIFKMGNMKTDHRKESFLKKAKEAYDKIKEINEK
jgi:hypothetical protein